MVAAGRDHSAVSVIAWVNEYDCTAGPLGTLTIAWNDSVAPGGSPSGIRSANVSVPFGHAKIGLGSSHTPNRTNVIGLSSTRLL